MSKVTFRARAIDASKELPIYFHNELPDLNDLSTVNRAIPNLPTGMEREEESEHHLKQAIMSQLTQSSAERPIIPTPEYFHSTVERNTVNKVKIPKNYISVHSDPFSDFNDEYDADTDDEIWIENFNKTTSEPIEIDVFEIFMSILDKKLPLTNKFTDIPISDLHKNAVQNYWQKKINRIKSDSLIASIRTEKSNTNGSVEDPYVAFRKRIEKMQTRKNRKNDEQSYENILILRRSFLRTKAIYSMLMERESIKKNIVELTLQIFDERVKINDYNNVQFDKLIEINGFTYPNIYSDCNNITYSIKPRLRHEDITSKRNSHSLPTILDDKIFKPHLIVSKNDVRLDPSLNEQFIFTRKVGVQYRKALDKFIFNEKAYSNHFHYSHSNCINNHNFDMFYPSFDEKNKERILCRPRMGRGGRIIFDRIVIKDPNFDEYQAYSTKDFTEFFNLINHDKNPSFIHENSSMDDSENKNSQCSDNIMENTAIFDEELFYDQDIVTNCERLFEDDTIMKNDNSINKDVILNGFCNKNDDFKNESPILYKDKLALVCSRKKRQLIESNDEWSSDLSTIDSPIIVSSDILTPKRAKLAPSFSL